MIGIGLVGTGRIGRVHLETLRKCAGAEVRALTDANLASAREVAGNIHVADSFEAILQNPEIQAVAICSSTDTHAEFITRAAQAGKHVFCEKPIDSDLARIDRVLEAVKNAGVKFMVGFNRRFDANHARIRSAIASGQIGTPHLLHIVSRDPAPPPIEYVKVSGGMFFDMTIHDFDMARFLLGEVEEIYATAGVLVDPAIGEAGDVDTALITLKFASGAMGSIDNSRKAVYGYDQRVEVFGSLGALRSENVHADQVTHFGGENVSRGLPQNFFMDRYLAAYQAELQAFIDCLVQDKPSPVSGADGRAPVVMALAARKSLRENRPVRLAEIR